MPYKAHRDIWYASRRRSELVDADLPSNRGSRHVMFPHTGASLCQTVPPSSTIQSGARIGADGIRAISKNDRKHLSPAPSI